MMRGIALAAACCAIASVAAVVARAVVLPAAAVAAARFPSVFELLVFVPVLWTLLHYAFGRRVEH